MPIETINIPGGPTKLSVNMEINCDNTTVAERVKNMLLLLENYGSAVLPLCIQLQEIQMIIRQILSLQHQTQAAAGLSGMDPEKVRTHSTALGTKEVPATLALEVYDKIKTHIYKELPKFILLAITGKAPL